MDEAIFNQIQAQFDKESELLLESAIISNLKMTPEQRIEAHQNALQLMYDLMEAGKTYFTEQSQGAS